MKVMKSSMDSLSQETDSRFFRTYKENDPEKAREQMVACGTTLSQHAEGVFVFAARIRLGVQEQYIEPSACDA